MNAHEITKYISEELTREGIDLAKEVEEAGGMEAYVERISNAMEAIKKQRELSV